MSKVCIFDLDGTLWQPNSHFLIVSKYYHLESLMIILRLFARFFPRLFQMWLDKSIESIPYHFIKKNLPSFRKDAEELISFFHEKGYEIIIISNAPEKILSCVSELREEPIYHSEISRKREVFYNVYSEVENLVVVTDNLSDGDLIEISDVSVIYTTEKRKKMFNSLKLPNNVIYKDFRVE